MEVEAGEAGDENRLWVEAEISCRRCLILQRLKYNIWRSPLRLQLWQASSTTSQPEEAGAPLQRCFGKIKCKIPRTLFRRPVVQEWSHQRPWSCCSTRAFFISHLFTEAWLAYASIACFERFGSLLPTALFMLRQHFILLPPWQQGPHWHRWSASLWNWKCGRAASNSSRTGPTTYALRARPPGEHLLGL